MGTPVPLDPKPGIFQVHQGPRKGFARDKATRVAWCLVGREFRYDGHEGEFVLAPVYFDMLDFLLQEKHLLANLKNLV